jgi:hypothetical protein
MAVQLFRPDGTPWREGIVRARVNRDCRILVEYPGTTFTHYVSTADEVVVRLDDTGGGSLPLFRQVLMAPTDLSGKVSLTTGYPQNAVAYNPYYIVTFPDGRTAFVVPPNQASAELDEFLWNPTVIIVEE